jgi:small multidrug resistance pump
MEQPRYPFIWQCVGMIVGVYGIGYLAAARDPVRHWPIVLVGFLGKIFGPLGYVMGVLKGEVPAAFGVTLPTNDLVWWVPFALILLHARASHQPLSSATSRP